MPEELNFSDAELDLHANEGELILNYLGRAMQADNEGNPFKLSERDDMYEGEEARSALETLASLTGLSAEEIKSQFRAGGV